MSAAVLATATVVLLAHATRPAAATPSKIQTGTVVSVNGQSDTLTLPSASTAGTLLIATVSADGGDPGTTPSGWTAGPIGGNGTANNQAGIYYYVNNPGGITSQAFSFPGSGWMAGQITEWTGLGTSSPIDVTKVKITGTASTTFSIAATAATADTDELSVAVYQELQAAASTDPFTPGTGWTNIGSTGAVSKRDHYTADYQSGVAVGTTESETQTATASGTWEAAIATFKDACTGGARTVTPPGTITFGAVVLNGIDKTTTASPAITASDMTGAGTGWNLQVTSTQFSDGNGHTLPTTASTATGVSVSAGTGNCTLPTNSITYPITVPAGAGPPTAVKVYDAAANTGGGPSVVTPTFSLAVPARTIAASYSATWTLTIASGP